MMVGPGETEGRRFRTAVASLFRHEPALPLLVVVDDSGDDAVRHVRDLVPASCECVRTANPEPPTVHHLGVNTLIALRQLAGRSDVGVAVKIDTDALVIAPFAARLSAYFADHPDVGQVGRAERQCDGSPTDFGFYRTMVRKQRRRLQVWRSPRWHVSQAFTGYRARVRTVSRRAAAHGLGDGVHCQGGAYAVSGEALRRLADEGLLSGDAVGRGYGLAEDLMTSTLVAATGLRVVSLTADGEPFAVESHGLPFPPAEAAERGYAIVHSVKNDSRFSEDEVVRFFESRDAAATPARA